MPGFFFKMLDVADLVSRHVKALNTVLALVVLVLLGQAAWQAMRMSALRAELERSQNELESRVESLAAEKLKFRREELVGAVQWLDDFYRAPEGLQRPSGLWRPDNTPDAEAIGVWILDVYMQARINGATDENARKAIQSAIEGSEEWRKKHGK